MAGPRLSGIGRYDHTPDPPYAGYRYPAEVVGPALWLYIRFSLSLREVEEILAARGISVTYETIRQKGLKFVSNPPIASADEPHATATNGTSTRLSSPSSARSTGSGASDCVAWRRS